MLRFVFLGMFILNVYQVSAQDYLITSDGDTLTGDVKGISNDAIKFRKTEEKKATWFKASEVQEAYDKQAKTTYAGRMIPGNSKSILLVVLEKGKVTLFESSFDWQSSTPNMAPSFHKSQKWYAAKGDSELVEVKTNSILGSQQQRKANLKKLLDDNPEIANKLSVDDFSFKSVRELIKDYNALPH
ncbi:hypothetical protein [Desertivirga brevis]|uniref:hypothetical protein n=1 Tax=Desertivirga brevis TaxID=2810310 RepID=UPI001A96B1F4|nr:hypothetical protein [Pedobacter sp. SYSU D00873]